MDAYYSNTLLGSQANIALGRIGPVNFALNGTQFNREADFFRAAARTFFPDGARETRVAFGVLADFSDYETAVDYASQQFAQLPKQGDLILVGGSDQRRLPSCVIDSVNATQFRGETFMFEYTFRGGLFLTENINLPAESDLVKPLNIALNSGELSHAISYTVPFASSPRGLPLVLSVPSGGKEIGFVVDETSRTAAGFTVLFDAPVPAAGYMLTGAAIL